MIWKGIRKLLFCFDAERVHHFLIMLIKRTPRPLLVSICDSRALVHQEKAQVTCMGLSFRSPVGLAAGFDKNAEIVERTLELGFGFIEIGTVTPRAQKGNPRPRLFREFASQSLLNRMGFNNLGADVISKRLEALKKRGKAEFPVGVNLGKNKETPNEQAAEDYTKVTQKFLGLADYFVINVSSPNTESLRALQERDDLKRIAERVMNECAKGRAKNPPVLVKLAPELFEKPEDQLQKLAEELDHVGISGWILTNTLQTSAGGRSGKVLSSASKKALQVFRPLTSGVIISVGGIFSSEEAQERLKLGANLIQIYTSWIYNGPRFPAQIGQKKSLGSKPEALSK